MSRFLDIEYLKTGSEIQKRLYKCLKDIDILNVLSLFDPIVVGTIPIGINIVDSDVDIICNVNDFVRFRSYIKRHFSQRKNFSDRESNDAYIARFECSDFIFEIYSESKPTTEQNAYRHMLIEDRILNMAGNEFREEIIKLKHTGYKTEPAFGLLLNLEYPYKDLLGMEKMTDDELKIFVSDATDALLDK